MRKRSLHILWLFIILISAYSCGFHYDLVTERKENFNFNNYKTYSIIHESQEFEMGTKSINEQYIDQVIKHEFENIGYVYSQKPDLLISWFVKVDVKLSPGIYNVYYNRWRSTRVVDVYKYKEGSLVIEIVDSYTKQVIWRAKASRILDGNISNAEQRIKEVINEIFQSYCRNIYFK